MRANALQAQSYETEASEVSAASQVDVRVSPAISVSSASNELQQELEENLRAARMEAKAGRFDQAARFYERVLRDDKDNVVAQQQLAAIAAELGSSSHAVSRYRTLPNSELSASPLMADQAESKLPLIGTRGTSLVEGRTPYESRWGRLRDEPIVLSGGDVYVAEQGALLSRDPMLPEGVEPHAPLPFVSGLSRDQITRTADASGAPSKVVAGRFDESQQIQAPGAGTDTDAPRYSAPENAAPPTNLMPEGAPLGEMKPYRRGETDVSYPALKTQDEVRLNGNAEMSTRTFDTRQSVRPAIPRIDLPLWTPKSAANSVSQPAR